MVKPSNVNVCNKGPKTPKRCHFRGLIYNPYDFSRWSPSVLSILRFLINWWQTEFLSLCYDTQTLCSIACWFGFKVSLNNFYPKQWMWCFQWLCTCSLVTSGIQRNKDTFLTTIFSINKLSVFASIYSVAKKHAQFHRFI